ncbi:methyl-accepting chemotaxis protein [Lysinibacillus piscis]|uniref:Methyl-accepting chemotaxis protein n=1 Tax=Lysinibacillus piscis TaxID=2518931 RepID=A0ABQ5NL83_9BACI|nr:methyl-accepting chemotaxis protein [Lysinibacillus sp. KH24]GLC89115.1 hypothetical protein LYSBPC_22420 [Lysinibacillus sp. KH24]
MRRGIQQKMVIYFSAILLVTCLTISWMSYQSSRQLIEQSLSSIAETIAEQALMKIDTTTYEQEVSMDEATSNTSYYFALRETLNEFRQSTGLSYLYTMARQEVADGYSYHYMVDGMPVGDEDESLLGDVEDNPDLVPVMKAAYQTGETHSTMAVDPEYGALISVFVPMLSQKGEVIGLVGADLDATDIYEKMAQQKRNLVILIAVALLVSFLMVYRLSSRLVKPLKLLATQVHRIGEGDLSVQIDTRSKDEIGTIMQAVQLMTNNLKLVIRSMNQNASQLLTMSNQQLRYAEEIKQSNGVIEQTMEELASGSVEQTISTTTMNETMEHFAHQIQQTAQKGEVLTKESMAIIDLTETGVEQITSSEQQMQILHEEVRQSVEQVGKLDRQTREISNFVTSIQEIAEQTNLLALNAAIEAARAGEHGKGFAVVADEVRKLADEVKTTVVKIAQIVSNIQQESTIVVHALQKSYKEAEEGTKRLQLTGATFGDIYKTVEHMQQQTQGMEKELQDMTNHSSHVQHSIEAVVAVTEEAQAGVENTSALVHTSTASIGEIVHNSEELVQIANELHALVAKFTLEKD